MKLRKLFLLTGIVFSLLLFCGISANAEVYSGECGSDYGGWDYSYSEGIYSKDLTWTLDTETGVLEITGKGQMAYWPWGYGQPWESYRSDIKTIVIGDGVTSIGLYAFNNCTNLTNITMPDSLTYIEQGVFEGCTSLTSVTIPNSVTRIDYYTFSRCTSLTSVTIPDSVAYIYPYAFEGCTSLTDVYYTGSEEEWANIYIDDTCLTNATIHYNWVEDSEPTTPTLSTDWLTATDSGYYFEGETKLGILRFLFARTPAEDEVITKVGIKYLRADMESELVSCEVDAGAALSGAFYSDIYAIPENDTATYYAYAFMKTEDGTVIISNIVAGTVNWANDYSDYQPTGGAN